MKNVPVITSERLPPRDVMQHKPTPVVELQRVQHLCQVPHVLIHYHCHLYLAHDPSVVVVLLAVVGHPFALQLAPELSSEDTL